MGRLIVTPINDGGEDDLPGVRIDLSGFPANRAIYVSRSVAGGPLVPVRQGEPITTNASGAETIYDYEGRFNVPLTYHAPGATSVRTQTYCKPYTGWLVDPGDPGASVRLPFVAEMDAFSFEDTGSSIRVMGRRRAVSIVNVARMEPTSTLQVRTDTALQESRMRGLLLNCVTPLIAIPGFAGMPDGLHEYVSLGGVSMGFPDRANTEQRSWSLPWEPTDRPIGGLRPRWTVGRLRQEIPNVATLRAQYATVGDLRRNVRRGA